MSSIENYDWNRLASLGWDAEFVEKMKNDPCWKGYEAIGMKTKNGRKVPNCVKKKPKKGTADHNERFDLDAPSPINDMAMGNALPKEPGTGPAKNPQMGEQVLRMPRTNVLEKASNKNGKLAMMAPPNDYPEEYAEGIHSSEPNGSMAINQLRVMREKIDQLLGMLYPDDNLEPWMATKLTVAGQNLASVADYTRFGAEY